MHTKFSSHVRAEYYKSFTKDEPTQSETEHERAQTLMKNISEQLTHSYF